jgi:hypothetical protein
MERSGSQAGRPDNGVSDSTGMRNGTDGRRTEVRQHLEALQLQALPLDAVASGSLIRSEAPFWAEFLRRNGIRLEP